MTLSLGMTPKEKQTPSKDNDDTARRFGQNESKSKVIILNENQMKVLINFCLSLFSTRHWTSIFMNNSD